MSILGTAIYTVWVVIKENNCPPVSLVPADFSGWEGSREGGDEKVWEHLEGCCERSSLLVQAGISSITPEEKRYEATSRVTIYISLPSGFLNPQVHGELTQGEECKGIQM